MDRKSVKDIAKDAAAEIAIGILLKFSKVNDLTPEQQIQLDEDARSVAEVVMIDVFEPFLVEDEDEDLNF